jgi:hypothetical protein
MIERGEQGLLELLDNVQQQTIQPVTEQFISKHTLIYTGEYTIYNRLPAWGCDHKTLYPAPRTLLS